MTDHEQLHRDGYVLLRGAIPADWIDPLRAAFDAGETADWPVPRGRDWRHSLLDLDPTVQALCRLPPLLAAAGSLIGERFFLAQVEGREPRPGGGYQTLHRDLSAERPGDTVNAIAFFDDYGPQNGATRVVPGSHRPAHAELPAGIEAQAVQLAGQAGDILVFDVDLVHAGSLNPGEGRRRSVLITYASEALREAFARTAPLRAVRMDTGESFDPVVPAP